MKIWMLHAAAIGAGFALAGCSPEAANSVAVPAPATISGGVARPASGAVGPATAATASPLWNGGQLTPLDEQVAHPNGVVLQLTSLQSRATETVVGVRIINGRDSEAELNRGANRRNGYILVGSGERIFLSPPPTNPQLLIPAGQTLEGELVFLGRLPRGQNAILILNENSSIDSENTAQPGYRIDLRLQGAAQ